MFVRKAGAYQNIEPCRRSTTGEAPYLSTNIKLGWKYLPLKLIANTCKLWPLKVLQHLGPGVNNVKRFFRQEQISWSV